MLHTPEMKLLLVQTRTVIDPISHLLVSHVLVTAIGTAIAMTSTTPIAKPIQSPITHFFDQQFEQQFEPLLKF